MRRIAVHIALGILSILMCWTTPTLAEGPFAEKNAARATTATPGDGPFAEVGALVTARPVGDSIVQDEIIRETVVREGAAAPDMATYPPVQLSSAVFVGDCVTPLVMSQSPVISFQADRCALECIAQTEARPFVATSQWTLAENGDDMIERLLTHESQPLTAVVWSEVGVANTATTRHLIHALPDDDILVAIANGSPAGAGL